MNNARRRTICVVASVFLFAGLSGADWEQRADLPANRYGGLLLPAGDTLYYLGGADAGWLDGLPDVWRYDPAANSWETRASMIIDTFLPGGGVVGNDIYIVGGVFMSGATSYLNDIVRIYDVVGDSWQTGSIMPDLFQGSAFAWSDGEIFLYGGSESGDVITNNFRVFDPGDDAWSAGPPMNSSRWLGAAWEADGGHYVAGGTADGIDGVTGASVLASGALSFNDPNMADLPEARVGAAFTKTWAEDSGDWRLYLLGGRDSSGTTHDSVWFYGPATDAWTVAESLPAPAYLAAAACLNGYMYVAGGLNVGGVSQNSFYRLDVGDCAPDDSGDDDDDDDDTDDDDAADDDAQAVDDDDDDDGCCGC